MALMRIKNILTLMSFLLCVDSQLNIYKKDGDKKLGVIWVMVNENKLILHILYQDTNIPLSYSGTVTDSKKDIKIKNTTLDKTELGFDQALHYITASEEDKTLIEKAIFDFIKHGEEPYTFEANGGKRKSSLPSGFGWGSWRSDDLQVRLRKNRDSRPISSEGKIYDSYGNESYIFMDDSQYCWIVDLEDQRKVYIVKSIDEKGKICKFCVTVREREKNKDAIEGIEPYKGTSKSFNDAYSISKASFIPDNILPLIMMLYFTNDVTMLRHCPGSFTVNSKSDPELTFTTGSTLAGHKLLIMIEIDTSCIVGLESKEEGKIGCKVKKKENNQMEAVFKSETTMREKLNMLNITSNPAIELAVLFMLKMPIDASRYPNIIQVLDGKKYTQDVKKTEQRQPDHNLDDLDSRAKNGNASQSTSPSSSSQARKPKSSKGIGSILTSIIVISIIGLLLLLLILTFSVNEPPAKSKPASATPKSPSPRLRSN